MSKDDKKPAFDPSRFAMPSTGAEEFGTRKIRSVISVNKPGKMEWVRLFDHVDYLIPGAALLDLQIARAFAHIEGQKRIKLTRKHWDCAGITDKDTRSRVIAKIRRECPGILLDAKQGRCTYIEFKRL